MRSRLSKAVGAVTIVAALAVGGATLASASSKAPSKAPAAKAPLKVSKVTAVKSKASPKARAADGDNIQQGDQSSPDTPSGGDSSSSSSSEQPAGESGSEVPGNDGPNGHADEPGNPNADHQFQGAE